MDPRPITGLRWPWPALAAWLACWSLQAGLRNQDVAPLSAMAAAAGAAALVALLWPRLGMRRRLVVALGFPLSVLTVALAAGLPAWAWLAAAAAVLALYPPRAWRDAPLFPSPADALRGLARQVDLPPGARVLDAGCGLGHGLAALHGEFPKARLEGIEWSRALAWACARRCAAFAQVRQGDLWRADWSGCDLVYLFQRPESMARAWAKAQRELRAGAWLASLEFEVPGARPRAVLRAGDGQRPLWIYRVGAEDASTTEPRGR